MKKILTTGILLSIILLYSCSKDILKITNARNYGFGGNTDNLPFASGTFTFHENGTLEYVNAGNATFKGSWKIVYRTRNDNTVHILQITAIDFSNQQVLTEYYDDMKFGGTNHFYTNVISTFHTYVTHFKR
jgi:hypothetical protein